MRNFMFSAIFVWAAGSSVLALSQIRDMWTGPVVLPQSEHRPPPERSMATDQARQLNRRQARDLPNPLANNPATIAQGAKLYQSYCTLCHGELGRGDGQLASFYRRMPDLTMQHVRNYPDGFLYTIIREGGRNMPRFADALSTNERWALVNFVKTLEPAPEASQE